MILTVIFEKDGRRIGYLREGPHVGPIDGRACTHQVEKAKSYHSRDEAAERMPALRSGYRAKHVECYDPDLRRRLDLAA